MPEKDLDQLLPQSIEMEKAVLGGILANNRAYEKVCEYLRPEHFSQAINAHIYGVCTQLIEHGKMADSKTLRANFGQEGILSDVGGWPYVAGLNSAGGSLIETGEYARCLCELYLKRKLVALGNKIVKQALSDSSAKEWSSYDHLESVEQDIYDLVSEGGYEGDFLSFKESATHAMQMANAHRNRGGALSGVATGIAGIDNSLDGLQLSELTILAGQQSIGKTEIAARIAYNAANAYHNSEGEEGAIVGFFSLKMTAENLATQVIADQANASFDSIRKGGLPEKAYDQLNDKSLELHNLPIFIDDTPELTLRAMRMRARKLKRQHSLGLIVVDYLQLIEGNPKPGFDKIIRKLKLLAAELCVPVLLLVRTPTPNNLDGNKRPSLANLSFIEGVEDIADTILLMYKESHYLEANEPLRSHDESEEEFIRRHDRWVECCKKCRGEAEIVVAKNSHGPTKVVNIQLDACP